MANYFDFTDLQLALNVAQARSLTKGAERTFLSLPAASHRIKNLETSLGVELFYRGSQGVTVSPAGEVFLVHARQVMQQLQYMQGDMKDFASGVKGKLRVFANTTAMSEYLPSILGRYLTLQPDVNVELRERLSLKIVQDVMDGVADIGIVAGLDEAVLRSPNLSFIPYRVDQLVFIAHPDHPLSGVEALDFVDTLEEDYICVSEWSAIHSFLRQAARNLGRSLRYRVEVSSVETVCRMVAAKVGVSVVPSTAAVRFQRNLDLAVVPLRDAWSQRRLKICMSAQRPLPSFAEPLLALLSEDAAQAEGATDE